jgi:hypothetical protein
MRRLNAFADLVRTTSFGFKASLWHVVCFPPEQELSQGLKVAPPSRTCQGTGISPGCTKIGVTGPEKRMAKTRLAGLTFGVDHYCNL